LATSICIAPKIERVRFRKSKAGVAELDLSQLVFRCEHCGFVADRDWNAAKNLERLAASSAASA